MAVIRSFIAIPLPERVQGCLNQVMLQLKERLQSLPKNTVHWVPAGNIHLTLKFLGDVSLSNLDLLKKMLLAEVSIQPPFEFSVGGVGAFPNFNQPRVVWVGIKSPPELLALQNGIESMAEKLGYGREERPFSPHLTLGRVARTASNQEARQIGEALQVMKAGFMGAVFAETVHLFKSDLKPTGSVYTSLLSAPLAIKKESAG